MEADSGVGLLSSVSARVLLRWVLGPGPPDSSFVAVLTVPTLGLFAHGSELGIGALAIGDINPLLLTAPEFGSEPAALEFGSPATAETLWSSVHYRAARIVAGLAARTLESPAHSRESKVVAASIIGNIVSILLFPPPVGARAMGNIYMYSY
jgi:hypothetical protein